MTYFAGAWPSMNATAPYMPFLGHVMMTASGGATFWIIAWSLSLIAWLLYNLVSCILSSFPSGPAIIVGLTSSKSRTFLEGVYHVTPFGVARNRTARMFCPWKESHNNMVMLMYSSFCLGAAQVTAGMLAILMKGNALCGVLAGYSFLLSVLASFSFLLYGEFLGADIQRMHVEQLSMANQHMPAKNTSYEAIARATNLERQGCSGEQIGKEECERVSKAWCEQLQEVIETAFALLRHSTNAVMLSLALVAGLTDSMALQLWTTSEEASSDVPVLMAAVLYIVISERRSLSTIKAFVARLNELVKLQMLWGNLWLASVADAASMPRHDLESAVKLERSLSATVEQSQERLSSVALPIPWNCAGLQVLLYQQSRVCVYLLWHLGVVGSPSQEDRKNECLRNKVNWGHNAHKLKAVGQQAAEWLKSER